VLHSLTARNRPILSELQNAASARLHSFTASQPSQIVTFRSCPPHAGLRYHEDS